MTCDCRSHNGFLTAKGLEETAQRRLVLAAVDAVGMSRYLDKVGSVSGLRRDEISMIFDDALLDEQHRRFLNEYSDEVGSPQGGS